MGAYGHCLLSQDHPGPAWRCDAEEALMEVKEIWMRITRSSLSTLQRFPLVLAMSAPREGKSSRNRLRCFIHAGNDSCPSCWRTRILGFLLCFQAKLIPLSFWKGNHSHKGWAEAQGTYECGGGAAGATVPQLRGVCASAAWYLVVCQRPGASAGFQTHSAEALMLKSWLPRVLIHQKKKKKKKRQSITPGPSLRICKIA